MCGLFGGMSTWLSDPEVNYIKDLAALSTLRGRDSTGITIAHVRDKKIACSTLVDLCNPAQFFDEEDTEDFLENIKPIVIMGHNRYATVGAVTLHNAQPMHHDHIIGCHNGTIDKFRPPKDKEKEPKWDNDSRTFIKLIAKQGLRHALKEAEHGAYALSFIDKKEGTINFIRNDRRPLYFMWTAGKGTLYWASERWILAGLACHNTWSRFEEPEPAIPHQMYVFEIGNTKLKEIVDLKPKTVHQIVLEGYKKWQDKNNEEKKEEKAPVQYPPKLEERVSRSLTDTKVDLLNGSMLKPGSSVPIVNDKRADPKGFYPLGAWYVGFDNCRITMQRVEQIFKGGCFLCGHKPKGSDMVWWTSAVHFICSTCKTDIPEKDTTWGPLHKGWMTTK